MEYKTIRVILLFRDAWIHFFLDAGSFQSDLLLLPDGLFINWMFIMLSYIVT